MRLLCRKQLVKGWKVGNFQELLEATPLENIKLSKIYQRYARLLLTLVGWHMLVIVEWHIMIVHCHHKAAPSGVLLDCTENHLQR